MDGRNDTLAAFDKRLAEHWIRGQWSSERMLQNALEGPAPAGAAHLWAWETVDKLLREAERELPESMANRRSLLFNNPALPKPTTTHTINMGVQRILPGETAWSHRHSMAALRFIIEGGADAMTVVNGEPCPMGEFDLILTPSGFWHDHHNRSSKSVTWLDVLDVPLVLSLNQVFYEPHREHAQPVSQIAAASNLVRPVDTSNQRTQVSMRYPWRDIEPQLRALADVGGTPEDGAALEYLNPTTGGAVLPSLSCWVQWLHPQQKTQRHRHSSSSVFFVVRGHGAVKVDDLELTWGPRDCFVIPNWAWHSFENSASDQEAILFSVNDTPVLKTLGLYREERDA